VELSFTILLSITNKMQRYTIFFIIVNVHIGSNKEYCITLHLVGYTYKEYINDARSHERQMAIYFVLPK